MLQDVITNTLETSGKTENFRKEMEDIKKNQRKILELKNTITKIFKNSMNSRLNSITGQGQRGETVNWTIEQ